MAFSAELGKEERKVIHKAAMKHGLKSKSYGKGDDRHLVLGRTAQQKIDHFKGRTPVNEIDSQVFWPIVLKKFFEYSYGLWSQLLSTVTNQRSPLKMSISKKSKISRFFIFILLIFIINTLETSGISKASS